MEYSGNNSYRASSGMRNMYTCITCVRVHIHAHRIIDCWGAWQIKQLGINKRPKHQHSTHTPHISRKDLRQPPKTHAEMFCTQKFLSRINKTLLHQRNTKMPSSMQHKGDNHQTMLISLTMQHNGHTIRPCWTKFDC
jgi:hypothetical protein